MDRSIERCAAKLAVVYGTKEYVLGGVNNVRKLTANNVGLNAEDFCEVETCVMTTVQRYVEKGWEVEVHVHPVSMTEYMITLLAYQND